MTESTVFIGIEPAGGRRALTFAVLDNRLNILKIGTAGFDDVVTVAAVYPLAVCGINAPAAPGRGLLADPGYRQRAALEPRRDNYSTFRVCEYEIRRRGIYIYNTPTTPEAMPEWMQTGLALYEVLRAQGFVDYPNSGPRRLLETNSQAAFTVILKIRPYPKGSVEGLLQRQLVLYEEGLHLANPMMLLEEWTRHHLLSGQLNLNGLYDSAQLDALAAAYTAFLLANEPQAVTAVGDPAEGQIIVPTASLQDSY